METTVNQRIKKLTERAANNRQFAMNAGISQQVLDHIVNKQVTKPSYDVLKKILDANPDVDANWLISGHGNMTMSGNNNLVIAGDSINSHNDNRHYYSDSPDVLRHEIEMLDARIKEKDQQIKEKDQQIKEKDQQIKQLLDILQGKK